ncbi:hypothetical protein MBLNU457_g2450t2 [Dothideomycetes sp. NU457]
MPFSSNSSGARTRTFRFTQAIGLSASVLLVLQAVSRGRHELEDDGRTNTRAWFSKPVFISKFFSNAAEDDDDATEPGQQAPPLQTRGHSDYGGVLSAGGKQSDEGAAAQTSADIFESLRTSFTNMDFSNIGEQITGVILPTWVRLLPGYIRKLQSEMSMAPGTLAEEIWQEAHDPECNPEIIWDANVRVASTICSEEQDFLRMRKQYTHAALARYLDVPEKDIHPDDVPVIAMCGSGGGLRAMVAGTSSYLSTQEAGLLDCVTYTAGVSGSCWLQSLFFSSVGKQDYHHIIEHLKRRLGVHIAFPPDALNLLSSAPTNKYLLSGVVEKLWGIPNADFGLVDVYGLLLAARLIVPRGDLAIDYYDLKVSDQQKYLDRGRHPLPIYTAVRHEIPEVAVPNKTNAELREQARKEAWFQWFEWTPYEFFCEELEAGIPTWAIGRQFDEGKTVWRDNGLALPELRMPMLMGIWGSAFCATLSHYYKEIRPIAKGLAGFAGIDSLIVERDDDLVKVHPIDPATIPNFVKNMKHMLPTNCPESIHKATNLQLMDAGMSNNLPIYPLLRPGRDVDVIITFDASADVATDNWLKVVDGYVRQRGIKGWPIGSGWPTDEESVQQALQEFEEAQATSVEDAEARLKRAQDGADTTVPRKEGKKDAGLGYCTVWVGSREERQSDGEPPPSKVVEDDWELMKPEAGVAVIYFPFMANDKVPGVDPQKSDFMSTWNFVYTPEEVEKVVNLARANFQEGAEQTRRTVRAVWQRKRDQRLEREKRQRESRWALHLEKLKSRAKLGDQGDHFS